MESAEEKQRCYDIKFAIFYHIKVKIDYNDEYQGKLMKISLFRGSSNENIRRSEVNSDCRAGSQ